MLLVADKIIFAISRRHVGWEDRWELEAEGGRTEEKACSGRTVMDAGMACTGEAAMGRAMGGAWLRREGPKPLPCPSQLGRPQ